MKKLVCLLLTVTLVLSVGGCSKKKDDTSSDNEKQQTSLSSQEETSIEEYAVLVSDCVEEIENASVLLSNMANYEYEYWSALDNIDGNFDTKKAVQKARDWLSEKADVEENKIETDYKIIVGKYSDVVEVNISDENAKLLNDNLTKLYDEYCLLYNLTISPGDNLSIFTTNYNSYVDNITNYLNTINTSIDNE